MKSVLMSSLLGALVLQVAPSKDGSVTLRTPAPPVVEGDEVVLYCQHWTGSRGKTTFFKNGAEVAAAAAANGSDGGAKMTIKNATRADEGYYKCASGGGGEESPESWLSVTPDPGSNVTSTNGTAASAKGSWVWITASCILLPLFLIPLSVWLVRHHRFCTRRCWLFSKKKLPEEKLPEAQLPATDPDVTEVQWDLSWMEMSDLLDERSYPGA